ncbi:MAG: hypothetical protein WCH99_12315 [Verrucomicrobiota bacterium]
MVDAKDRCPVCHSIVQRKIVLCMFFFFTEARYRMKYIGGSSRYAGRRFKYSPEVERQLAEEAATNKQLSEAAIKADEEAERRRIEEENSWRRRKLNPYAGLLFIGCIAVLVALSFWLGHYFSR